MRQILVRWPAASKVAAGVTLFLGLFTTIFAAAHLYGVMATAQIRSYTYDFSFAALLIVGMTMVAGGVLCVAPVRELARGDRIGWERALYGTVLLLLVTVPLGPYSQISPQRTYFWRREPSRSARRRSARRAAWARGS